MENKGFERGFSLLEILVALAIFAVVSVAAYQQINATATTATRVEEKYIALWVAENSLEKYFSERQWSAAEEELVYEMAGREWFVKIKIEDAEEENLRWLEATVRLEKDDRDPGLITLSRMMGKY